jgi:ribonuclease HI
VNESPIVVFSDGAAKGNPGPGGWGAIVVARDGHVTELGGADAHTTNNKMELTAAIRGLQHVQGAPGRVDLYTDSTYVIKGIREWIWSWRKRGWKTVQGADVLNRELWEELHALVEPRGRSAITWHYVRGHVGIPGNERVDEIADTLARQGRVDLYRGPLNGYPVNVLDLPSDTTVPARTQGSASAARQPKGAPFSYLSLVDGQLMRHRTWADCERRVKGRSGARFKKAQTQADEREILRSWGVEPADR